MTETIHVACNIDSKYTRFCGVLMVSLFENNKVEIIKMHILADSLTDEDKNNLAEIAHRYSNQIQFYEVDKTLFEEFPTSNQWPKVIYYRLMLPEIIDKEVKRVLYVDCDIIFRGPIKELFDINLDGKIIGAVEDVLSIYSYMIENLGYSPTNYYFNSGVILIDVKSWINNNITKQCLDFIRNNNVKHPDQDALNAILNQQWLRLHHRWNFISNYHTFYIDPECFKADFNVKGTHYPVIIHFSGIKPWNSACQDPYKLYFFEYQKYTKWGCVIPKHSIKEYIFFTISVLLDKFKIRKRNEYYRF